MWQISRSPRRSRSASFRGVSQFPSSDTLVMMTAEPPAVAIEGVSHCYGRRQALDDVTFSITPSTFAVLHGLPSTGNRTLSSLLPSQATSQHTHHRHGPTTQNTT